MSKKLAIKKRLPRRLFILCCCLLFLALPAGHPSMAEDIPQCRNTLPFITPDDLAQVLFVVAGTFSDQEKANLHIDTIMADTSTALDRAGIKATIVAPEAPPEASSEASPQIAADASPETSLETPGAASITASRFLKVRIYSIMLERQVYFCSAKIIKQQPSGEECFVREYSNVVSSADKIREVTADMVNQVLKDVRW